MRWLLALAAIGLASGFSRLQASQSVELTWEGSPSDYIVGYRIFFGPQPGAYTSCMVVDQVSDILVSGLKAGATYYFVVAAFDAYGNESGFSNETSYTVPAAAGEPKAATPTKSVQGSGNLAGSLNPQEIASAAAATPAPKKSTVPTGARTAPRANAGH